MTGPYTAHKGKLPPGDPGDYRTGGYVTGPALSGRICPVASFWRWEEAQAWAKARNNEAAREAESIAAGGQP